MGQMSDVEAAHHWCQEHLVHTRFDGLFFVSYSGGISSEQKNCVCTIILKEAHTPNCKGPRGNIHQPLE